MRHWWLRAGGGGAFVTPGKDEMVTKTWTEPVQPQEAAALTGHDTADPHDLAGRSGVGSRASHASLLESLIRQKGVINSVHTGPPPEAEAG